MYSYDIYETLKLDRSKCMINLFEDKFWAWLKLKLLDIGLARLIKMSGLIYEV